MDGQATNILRIPTLSRDNYDTWKLRIQAVMIKNKTWAYVSGEKSQASEAEESKGKGRFIPSG